MTCLFSGEVEQSKRKQKSAIFPRKFKSGQTERVEAKLSKPLLSLKQVVILIQTRMKHILHNKLRLWHVESVVIKSKQWNYYCYRIFDNKPQN